MKWPLFSIFILSFFYLSCEKNETRHVGLVHFWEYGDNYSCSWLYVVVDDVTQTYISSADQIYCTNQEPDCESPSSYIFPFYNLDEGPHTAYLATKEGVRQGPIANFTIIRDSCIFVRLYD
ncbi:MAG: hypothetical protein KJO64_03245 [Bacteroidia bacterium]|nr:hypothetical protein [Bacteroidia bacterium]NNC84809.1 hypothetical protein [Bacteroidia bacterium]